MLIAPALLPDAAPLLGPAVVVQLRGKSLSNAVLAAALLTQASHPAASTTSVALLSTARAALPVPAFSAELSGIDEQGALAGAVISVDQGMTTTKTQHALVRGPTSAFISKGVLVMIGLSSAKGDALTRMTTPVN